MKKFFASLILLVFTSVIYAQGPQNMDSLKVVDSLYYFNGEPYNGGCYGLFSTGELGFKGKIVNGKKEGMWKYWYSSGAPKRESEYANNRKNGMTYYWHKNGVKSKEIKYINNKNVDQKLWDEEGNRLPNPGFDSF